MTRFLQASALACALLVCGLVSAADAADAAKGKTIYEGRCSFCHGMSGKGDGPAGAALKPAPTNFTSVEVWKSTPPEAMKGFVENGKPTTSMVAFKGTLTAEQIDDVVAYLESFKPH